MLSKNHTKSFESYPNRKQSTGEQSGNENTEPSSSNEQKIGTPKRIKKISNQSSSSSKSPHRSPLSQTNTSKKSLDELNESNTNLIKIDTTSDYFIQKDRPIVNKLINQSNENQKIMESKGCDEREQDTLKKHNVAHKQQQTASNKQYQIISQINHQTGLKNQQQSIPQKKAGYMQNRIAYISWLDKECKRLQLSKQTYANSVYLLDSYYDNNQFEKDKVKHIALCIVIISSKINQFRILCTQKMARNNKIDPEVLKKVELQILQNLSFNITSNNYARIIITYLEKWEEVSYIKILCFDNHLQPKFEDYLIFQQLFYLANRQVKQKMIITVREIIQIFRIVFSGYIQKEKLNCYLKKVFQAEQYQNGKTNHYLTGLRADLSKWKSQFDSGMAKDLRIKFQKRNTEYCYSYSQFLTLHF